MFRLTTLDRGIDFRRDIDVQNEGSVNARARFFRLTGYYSGSRGNTSSTPTRGARRMTISVLWTNERDFYKSLEELLIKFLVLLEGFPNGSNKENESEAYEYENSI